MKSQKNRLRTGFIGFIVVFSLSLNAQFIDIKSVPVATGDQFLTLPTQNLGMAGVNIALDDPFSDPFINPAKGVRTRKFRLFSAPVFYSISGENGAARTLPFGMTFNNSQWFGGFSLAVQQMSAPESFAQPRVFFNSIDVISSEPQTLSDKNQNNLYVAGYAGKQLSDIFSVAAGVSWAGLNGVDGVELLFSRSEGIEQFGQNLNYRVGLLGEWESGRTLEAVLLHNRFNMTYDVSYPGWWFDGPANTQTVRNLDQTRTWGLHLGYTQHLAAEEGWRIGGIFTINRKSHPKIPNYELMNIPRDPGTTWAFNAGMGVSLRKDATTFGFDFIFEPIFSNTWADAAGPVETISGRTLPAGAKTVENDFEFTNWKMRIGVGIDEPENIMGFQLGLQVHWIQYWLDQENFVQEFRRSQQESWAEWTPSLGILWKFSGFKLNYTARLKLGTGRPGVDLTGNARDFLAGANAGDIILAPEGALTLQEARVLTHQVTLSIPIGE